MFASGTWWQRSILCAKPIRTPHHKATSNTRCTNPQQNIHRTCTYVHPFIQLHQIKNFQGKREQNNAHDLQLSLYTQFALQSGTYFVYFFSHCIMQSILFSPCSVFSSPKHGGWDILYTHWVWIDFCLAHFSWFRLCHFQGAPDEGPLGHRCRQFSR